MNPLAEDLDHILAHTSGIWDSLRGQNIFVTGGTGFFGRWILESFAHVNRELKLGAHMVVLSRDPKAFKAKAPHLATDPAIQFVSGDVRTFTAATVQDQLGNQSPGQYSFVLHAATESSAKLKSENPLLMIDTVVAGTRSALEFAVASEARRFLLTSSGAVYGRQPSTVTHMPESYRGGPDLADANSAYGEAKRMAELLCACFCKEFDVEPVIARCFAFAGPYLPLDGGFAIGNFIRDALNGGPIHVNGDGSPRRSYLYASDLAIWLWTILVLAPPMGTYNVGSEDDRSIRQVAEAVAAAAGDISLYIAKQMDSTKPAERYVPSCARAREELTLCERVRLPEAIERTLAFHRRSQAD